MQVEVGDVAEADEYLRGLWRRFRFLKMSSLVWFRVDLRILDNPALCSAIKQAIMDKSKVIACCIMSPAEDKRHDRSPHQVDFMLRNMKLLSKDLY